MPVVYGEGISSSCLVLIVAVEYWRLPFFNLVIQPSIVFSKILFLNPFLDFATRAFLIMFANPISPSNGT